MDSDLKLQYDRLAENVARIVAPRVVAAIYANRPKIAPEWLNFDQAAAYLGYTTTKAFRDRCSKPCPPPSHKLGRLRRFNRVELDAWLRGGAKGLPSEG